MTSGTASTERATPNGFQVAHLTTVDLSLRFLLRAQLLAVVEAGGEAVGVSSPGPWVEELEHEGIRHIALSASTRGMSPLNDMRAAYQLWRVLRREEFTVLHTHNPKPGMYGRALGRLAGVPLVVNTSHGMYATQDDGFLRRALVYVLEAAAARFSDVELYQNPEDLEFSKRHRILPRGKGVLLGNGVDLVRFDPARIDEGTRARLRAEFGAGDDQIVVGMVGRLVIEKGYMELFEAAAALGDRYIVVVVGPEDPEKADAVSAESVTETEKNGVLFLGMRTDIEDVYKAMDIFVLPSHREGFPRAAMEAAAMGLPVVATDIRGCRQVVDDGVNGFLVPVRDPDALRDAIERVGGDNDLRKRMATAGRQMALERFDERQVVKTVMESYREGLMRKGLGHVMPSGMVEDPEPSPIREARPEDSTSLANLHSRQIHTGFLPRLGPRFMGLLYRALIGWPGAVVLVVDDGGGVAAFVAGVVDMGTFYRYFTRNFGWKAALVALPRLVRPANVAKAWESFRYGQHEGEIPAELLSMVVAPRARGERLSVALGRSLLKDLAERGAPAVRVVVGSDNAPAIAAYRKMGFIEETSIEVHAGEISEVLVWRA